MKNTTKEKGYSANSYLSNESINQRFEVSKQLLIMNSSPVEDSKEQKVLTRINEILYGQPDANANEEEFYILLNIVHNNFLTRLTEAFPELNENEIQICCLMKAGFDTSKICFISKYAPTTIRIKKTNIRKKVGITDGGNIIDFLDEYLTNLEEKKRKPFWKNWLKFITTKIKPIPGPY